MRLADAQKAQIGSETLNFYKILAGFFFIHPLTPKSFFLEHSHWSVDENLTNIKY